LTIDLSGLISREAPWVHRPTGALGINEVMERVEAAGGRVVTMDGRRMPTAESLFREYVREFHFPEYFGYNWDAFYECMRELEGIPAPAYLTVVEHSDQVLSENSRDLAVYLELLADIGKYWSNSFGLGPEWGGGEVAFNSILLPPAPAQKLI
jgi:RNAse (barnase) inhibitor barstar